MFFTMVYMFIGVWAKVDTDEVRIFAGAFILAVLTMIGISLYVIPLVRTYVRIEMERWLGEYDD